MSAQRRSFRLVCRPDQEAVVEAMLHGQGYAFEPDPFFGPARRLTAEPRPLGSSLAAFFGLVYIQDRASMLPPVALAPAPGTAVLDMCASPGSKTGQLAGMTGPTGLVLGNEPSPARLATLRRNLHIMGLSNVVTCCHSGEALPLPGSAWSHIQLDPPCSGWGTVERNPKVRDMWKDDKIRPLIRLQRALLAEAARLLAPGGVMTYSTCTTNVEENEAQIWYAVEELGLEPEALPDPAGFVLDAPEKVDGRSCDGVWRLSPRPGDTQGFFVARLRKLGGGPHGAAAALSFPPASPSAAADDLETPDLRPAPDHLSYTAVPPHRLEEHGLMPAALPGPVGIFGDSLHVLPAQALALLPAGLRWQGMYAGKTSRGGDIRLSPRLRTAPDDSGTDAPPVVDVEGPAGLAELESLVAGRSAPWTPPAGMAHTGGDVVLRWNGLPLGRARIKGRRLIWSER